MSWEFLKESHLEIADINMLIGLIKTAPNSVITDKGKMLTYAQIINKDANHLFKNPKGKQMIPSRAVDTLWDEMKKKYIEMGGDEKDFPLFDPIDWHI